LNLKPRGPPKSPRLTDFSHKIPTSSKNADQQRPKAPTQPKGPTKTLLKPKNQGGDRLYEEAARREKALKMKLKAEPQEKP